MRVVDPASLFGELKRRHVFRALVGYGIAAFAVLRIIEPIAPSSGSSAPAHSPTAASPS
jgi:hypothetical protein